MRRRLSIFAIAMGALPSGCDVAKPAVAAPRPPRSVPLDPATAATVLVRVRVEGKPPANPSADVSIDRCCQAANPRGLANERVVVGADGALRNVYVHVKSGIETYQFSAPSGEVHLDQRGCVFAPRVVALQAGQPLRISNSDPTFHNVLARPSINDGFNEPIPAGAPRSFVFAMPEVGIPLACNVHPWMQAWCCVSGDPVFGVSGDDGAVTMTPLPPGDLEIEAWHEVYGSKVEKVTLAARESRTIEITFQAAK